MFNRLLGFSDFQIEISKAFSFNWKIRVFNFSKVEYRYRNNLVSVSLINGQLIFDLPRNNITVSKDLASTVFDFMLNFKIKEKISTQNKIGLILVDDYNNEYRVDFMRDKICFSDCENTRIATFYSRYFEIQMGSM
jgi:hypothetical protein